MGSHMDAAYTDRTQAMSGAPINSRGGDSSFDTYFIRSSIPKILWFQHVNNNKIISNIVYIVV
jgi:hypothetical protein